MVAFAVLAATLLLANPQSSHITFETRAASLDKVMSGLSASTGIQLECSPEMDAEIVIISAHDASLSEVLQRLARVTTGRWLTSSNRHILVPDHKSRDAERARELKYRVDRFRQILKQKLEGTFDWSLGIPWTQGEFKGPPPDKPAAYEVLKTIYPQIDPATIAALPENGRIVYSTSPNSLQLPLAVHPAAVSTFINKHNVIAAQAMKEAGMTGEQIPASLPFFKPIKGTAAKILFALRRNANDIAADLVLYDSRGSEMYVDDDEFAMEYLGQDVQGELARSQAELHNGPAQGTLISYSDTSKALLEFPSANGAATQAYEAARTQLSHPALNDPLSFFFSDAALSTAADRHENLIGDIPDSAYGLGSPANGAALSTTQFLTRITEKGSVLKTIEQDGWLEIAPSSPSDTRSRRCDRKALEALLGSVQEHGGATLDDLAAYAGRSEAPDQSNVSRSLLFQFLPDSESPHNKDWDWTALKFYGTLSPEQMLRKQIPFATMSAEQLALIEKMAYAADAHLETPGHLPKPQSIDATHGLESTESLPSGVPLGGYLEIVSHNTPVVTAADWRNPMYLDGAMDAQEYGNVASMPYFAQRKSDADRFKLGERTEVTLKFELAPGIELRKALHASHFASEAPPLSAKDLPEEFLAAAEESAKRRKSQIGETNENSIPPCS